MYKIILHLIPIRCLINIAFKVFDTQIESPQSFATICSDHRRARIPGPYTVLSDGQNTTVHDIKCVKTVAE